MEIKKLLFCFGMKSGFLLTLVLMIATLTSISLLAKDIYLIEGAPRATDRYQMPFQTILFRVNMENRSLDSLWALGEGIPTRDIRIYNEPELAIISEGADFSKKIHILSEKGLIQDKTVELKNFGYVYDQYLLKSNGEEFCFLLKTLDSIKGGGFDYHIIDIDGKTIKANAQSLDSGYSIRLSGPLPPYGNGKADVLSVNIEQENVSSIGISINMDLPAIPKDLLKCSSSRGWVMVANNKQYAALESVADRQGLTQRELIIFSRNNETWRSILIKGAATAVRPIGEWLIGGVADVDPKTDFETGLGYPPIITDEAVFVNPLSGGYYCLHLGGLSEVLWIENGIVYYRVNEELYKGRLTDNDLIDRELILQDPRIRYIHWAFQAESAVKAAGRKD